MSESLRPAVLLASATERLRAGGVASPQADARTLLAWVMGIQPWQLAIGSTGEADAARFEELVAARAAGRPLQYLTGVAHFRTVSLAVGPGVFIPRPETEVLAGWAIDRVRAGAKRVVELCAGSGAMTLAILTEAQPFASWAVEVEPAAIRYLRRNLTGTTAHVVQADMAVALPDLDGTVDLVVANPPYIARSERDRLPRELMAEPARALFADDDGLAAIQIVADTGWRLLNSDGMIGCEHGDGQADVVMALFEAGGWTQIESHRDLTSRPRFVTARRPRVG